MSEDKSKDNNIYVSLMTSKDESDSNDLTNENENETYITEDSNVEVGERKSKLNTVIYLIFRNGKITIDLYQKVILFFEHLKFIIKFEK